jgi:hypothetical protein
MPEGDTTWVSPLRTRGASSNDSWASPFRPRATNPHETDLPDAQESTRPKEASLSDDTRNSIGAVAAAAVAQTRGLIPGAVENSLVSVVELARTHSDPEMGDRLEAVLADIAAQYTSAPDGAMTEGQG